MQKNKNIESKAYYHSEFLCVCVCVWVFKFREYFLRCQINNFGGGMKIACLKCYLLFQLFFLKRFYSSAQILFHASWRSSIRNKPFFCAKKRRGVDINFALRKKTWRCCKKKSFLSRCSCYVMKEKYIARVESK